MLGYLVRRLLLAVFTCWAIRCWPSSSSCHPAISSTPTSLISPPRGVASPPIRRSSCGPVRTDQPTCPVLALDVDDAVAILDGRGVAAAGDGGHRRPTVDDGRFVRRGDADLDWRCRSHLLAVRLYSPLDYLFTPWLPGTGDPQLPARSPRPLLVSSASTPTLAGFFP